MKLYQELFQQYKAEIAEVKELTERENDPEISDRELAEILWAKEAVLGTLTDAVNAAYSGQVFKTVRNQGKSQFWKLVNEYLQ